MKLLVEQGGYYSLPINYFTMFLCCILLFAATVVINMSLAPLTCRVWKQGESVVAERMKWTCGGRGVEIQERSGPYSSDSSSNPSSRTTRGLSAPTRPNKERNSLIIRGTSWKMKSKCSLGDMVVQHMNKWNWHIFQHSPSLRYTWWVFYLFVWIWCDFVTNFIRLAFYLVV